MITQKCCGTSLIFFFPTQNIPSTSFDLIENRDNDAFKCSRKLAIGKRRQFDRKRLRRSEKVPVAWNSHLAYVHARWNKVLEGINNLRRFLFFRPLAPGETAGQVSEASIRKKSVLLARLASRASRSIAPIISALESVN